MPGIAAIGAGRSGHSNPIMALPRSRSAHADHLANTRRNQQPATYSGSKNI